jgi:hypothetical protein
MTFEHIAIVDFGLALNEVFEVGRLFFLRHLPFDSVEAGSFLANGRVLNRLPNRKLKRHLVPFMLWVLLAAARDICQQIRTIDVRQEPRRDGQVMTIATIQDAWSYSAASEANPRLGRGQFSL